MPDATVPNATILIIDDERVVREMLPMVMVKYEFEVLAAGGGEEGLALFRERAKCIDLVLLDLSMPDISGIEVLAQMREQDPQVKVAILTGFADDDPELEGLEVIYKPFRVGELLERVHYLLR
jgi:DNA-binding response OmpR family regulator